MPAAAPPTTKSSACPFTGQEAGKDDGVYLNEVGVMSAMSKLTARSKGAENTKDS